MDTRCATTTSLPGLTTRTGSRSSRAPSLARSLDSACAGAQLGLLRLPHHALCSCSEGELCLTLFLALPRSAQACTQPQDQNNCLAVSPSIHAPLFTGVTEENVELSTAGASAHRASLHTAACAPGGGGCRGRQQHRHGRRPAQKSVSSSTLLATSAAPTTPPAGRPHGSKIRV